jgi:hypothetical protein
MAPPPTRMEGRKKGRGKREIKKAQAGYGLRFFYLIRRS